MTRHNIPAVKKPSGFWHPDSSICAILFLVFLFAVFSVIYTDSSNASAEQQRKLAYGSWHVAAYGTNQETFRLLHGHATVQSAGYMEIYGTITQNTNNEKNDIGSIGYADPNMISIGNIKLLDGRFPVKEDEIAVEASCLTRLGIEKQPGQPITVTVSRKNRQGELQTDIQNYTLCGIIQNYTQNWKTGENPLLSFFVCPDAFDAVKPETFHVFVRMKPEFAANAESLSALCSWNSYFTGNDFTYLQYTKEGAHTPVFSVWQIILLLSGTLFTLTLTQADIRQSSRSFLILRTLGASKKQILSVFLQGKARVICISSISGIICGVLASFLISLLPGSIPAWPDIYSFQAMHLLRIILSLYAGVIFSVAVSLIPLLHIPLYQTPQKQTANIMSHIHPQHNKEQRKKNRRIIAKSRKKSPPVAALFRAADRRQNFFQAALTFIVAVFIYFLVYQAWNAGCIYLNYQNDFPEDCTFGNLSAYTPPHSVITENELLQIQHTYGVENAVGVAVSNNCEITFSDGYDRLYADKIHSFLARKNASVPDTGISGILIGCPDPLLLLYTKELDSGVSEKILAEDEVILYLPDYCTLPDGSLRNPDITHGMQILSERTIAIGSKIHINTGKTGETLKVAGIIRSWKDTMPESYCLVRPYSIICHQDTYRRIFGQSDYAFVQVYQDPAAIPYQTAIELSHQENGLYFHNKRSERIRLSQNMISQTMLALLLCTSAFLAAMSIRFGLYSFYGKQVFERYQTLYRLGMPKSAIKKALFQRAFLNSFAGCGLAAIIFLTVCFIRLDQKPHLFAVFLILGVFLLNVLILTLYDYWYVRRPS